MRLAVLFVSSCFLCFGVDPSAELLFADSSKASRVDVRVTACDIAVEGTDSGKITVTLEKKIHKKWESSEPPRARISGDALVVDGGCRETKRLLISVPRSYPYRVRMAAGNVTVSGMESSGDVPSLRGTLVSA